MDAPPLPGGGRGQRLRQVLGVVIVLLPLALVLRQPLLALTLGLAIAVALLRRRWGLRGVSYQRAPDLPSGSGFTVYPVDEEAARGERLAEIALSLTCCSGCCSERRRL